MSISHRIAEGRSGGGTPAPDPQNSRLQVSARSDPAPSSKPCPFESILFETPDEGDRGFDPTPECFRDLHLDQVFERVTKGREDYNLRPFYHFPLTSIETIVWRHEVMRDLERAPLFKCIKTFSEQMRSVQNHLRAVQKLYYVHQKEAWVLEAAESYCDAVQNLRIDLDKCPPASRGLRAFHHYIADYVLSARFKTLEDESDQLRTDLSEIKYSLLIQELKVTVCPYADQPDYSAVVEGVFARFQMGAQKDYRTKFPESSGMNHVEALVLDRVALLNPEVFGSLAQFCARRRDFFEPLIATFDREVQFYLAYLEHMRAVEATGLNFCFPEVSGSSKEISSSEGFDLALAGKLVSEGKEVVTNDFYLRNPERIFVVTGPNQGGKTTFARTFGQLHYLASLGLPVPGTAARLFLYDRLFVHFEREEDISTLRGKLEDDLFRMHGILEQATPNSLIVINEIFSSTTLKDAVALGTKVLEQITQLDCLATCVTFLDELASLNEKVVSIVAEVVPGNVTLRTHRLERKPADGLAYALAIAKKYRLTYPQLKKRLQP